MSEAESLVVDELNAVLFNKVEDPDNLRPFYTVEKDGKQFCLFVNVGDEKYSIYETSSESNMIIYLQGMVRGLKVERKPVWKH